ncbi:MAG: hypothetical protein ACI9U2_001727 [Bradymonadia bacterium]|jgi:hypothetical protein
MRCVLLLVFVAPLMAQARVPGLTVGVGLDLGTTTDSAGLFGDLPTIVDALDGQFEQQEGALRPALRLGYQFSEWFALEARTRLLSTSASGTFEGLSTLDYDISKTVIPVQLLPRLTLDSAYVGLALGIGPGLYFIRTHEGGHLGEGRSSQFTVGLSSEVALAIHLSDRVVAELTLNRETFELSQTNALIRDGGTIHLWSGGVTLAYTFEG